MAKSPKIESLASQVYHDGQGGCQRQACQTMQLIGPAEAVPCIENRKASALGHRDFDPPERVGGFQIRHEVVRRVRVLARVQRAAGDGRCCRLNTRHRLLSFRCGLVSSKIKSTAHLEHAGYAKWPPHDRVSTLACGRFFKRLCWAGNSCASMTMRMGRPLCI